MMEETINTPQYNPKIGCIIPPSILSAKALDYGFPQKVAGGPQNSSAGSIDQQ